MINPDAPVFPNNIVSVIFEHAGSLDEEVWPQRHPVRSSDPNTTVAVFGSLWYPDEQSLEMHGGTSPGPQEPTIQRYNLTIQSFIKDMDEDRGLAKHSVLSQMVRAMLYRDTDLRVALAQLAVTANGVTERTLRWGMNPQRFLSNEVSGDFLYLSTLDFWAETESR